MNTPIEAAMVDPRAPVAAPHPTHKLRLLLRREFWEHKGGFLWAPLVAGGISLLLTAMAIVVGEVAMKKAMVRGDMQIDGHVMVNGLDIGALTSKMSPEDMHRLADGLNLSLLMAASWPFIVLSFVVFFYCLGALYDERKDRSVLFWKSLPVSDTETVLSKVVSAVLVAPVLATGAALATMLAFLVLLSVVVLFHSGNPVQLLWLQAQPIENVLRVLSIIPVYALWALPTVGWLMLCSAWARSKPFLWALMLPVFSGIFVSWFDLMQMFNLESTWFWKNVVARALFSAVPGSWIGAMQDRPLIHGPQDIDSLLNLQSTYSVLLTPQLWVGVLAGAAMIVGAIRLRRWRDEG